MRRPRNAFPLKLVTLVLGLASVPQAFAGAYVAPSVKWAAFAARPQSDEATVNYYGYGGGASFGYSLAQKIDLGLFGTYIPGHRQEAVPGKDDASLVSYGVEFASRFADSVYVGFRGGVSTYHLFKAKEETEISGEWHGPSGGFSVGAVVKLSKQSLLLTTFDMAHHVLTASDSDDGESKRRFDSFSISLTYMFNYFDTTSIENTIIRDFLN